MIHKVFAATPDELEQVLRWGDVREPAPPPPPRKHWWSRPEPAPPHEPDQLDIPIIETGWIDDVGFACLEALLHDEPLDDIDAVVDLIQDFVAEDPPGNPEHWISPVSQRLVAALVAADSSRLEAVAEPWAATEEMRGWDAASALAVLTELAGFCREAQASGRNVFRSFGL